MVQADDVPEAGDGAVTLSLVERLRRRTVERTEPHPNGWGHVKREYPDPLCQQAADEIERLRSQGGAPEPTDDMAEAGRDWAQREWKASGDPKGYLDFYRGIYRAMLSAAPQPPVSQSGCVALPIIRIGVIGEMAVRIVQEATNQGAPTFFLAPDGRIGFCNPQLITPSHERVDWREAVQSVPELALEDGVRNRLATLSTDTKDGGGA